MTGLQFIARIQTLQRNEPTLLLGLDTAPLTGSMVLQSNVLLNRHHAPTMKYTAQPTATSSKQGHCSTGSTLHPTKALPNRQHLSCRQVHCSTGSALLPTNALLKQQDPPPNKHTVQPAGPLSQQKYCSNSKTLLPTNTLLNQ